MLLVQCSLPLLVLLFGFCVCSRGEDGAGDGDGNGDHKEGSCTADDGEG